MASQQIYKFNLPPTNKYTLVFGVLWQASQTYTHSHIGMLTLVSIHAHTWL